MKDFAAIDFETANEWPSSVCSVGVVVVRGGCVVDRLYSLIHPEPEYYSWFCRRVHGLGPEDTEAAPVFPHVWERIAPAVAGLPLVAHNARFDEGCLRAVFRVYQKMWNAAAAVIVPLSQETQRARGVEPYTPEDYAGRFPGNTEEEQP